MVVVAVVGGTGSVGKTIVEAFEADGTHEVIVIGRKVSSSSLTGLCLERSFADKAKVPEGEQSVPAFAVDYSNIDHITRTLNEKKVHTVICTIAMYDPVSAQSERNMIEAAANSATVKRFVQSNWGDKTPEDK
jgi:dTDP-4-dehydrorhamnose reductase